MSFDIETRLRSSKPPFALFESEKWPKKQDTTRIMMRITCKVTGQVVENGKSESMYRL